MTPLILAIIKPRTAAVRGLLAEGANPNLRRENGDTAVTLAAQSGGNDLTVLKLLLDAGGDPNARMRSDDPILMVYIGSYTLEAIRRLARHGANLDALSRTETPLIVNAALAQSWDVVWTMIELGATYRAARPFPGVQHDIARRLPVPATLPGSPIWPYKVKVWEFLKEKGVPGMPAELPTTVPKPGPP